MPNSPDGHRTANGRALSIAVHTFDGAFRALSFAEPVKRLREALSAVGFSVETRDNPNAEELGAAVTDFLTAPGDGARVVHVMTHGVLAEPTRQVHAVGADAEYVGSTNAESWPNAVETYKKTYGDQYTLFLLDFCFSGRAAWPAWSAQSPGHQRRSWVIAASEPDHVAYSAVLTRALGDLIQRLARRESVTGLKLDPAEPYVPFGLLVEETRVAVRRLLGEDDSAPRQYVVATPVSGKYPQLPFFANPFRLPPDFFSWFGPANGKRRLSGEEVAGTGFIGRRAELAELSAWLDAAQTRGAGPREPLRVVTGRRGSGKSALLGMLIGAAHHDYPQAREVLWQGDRAADAPSRYQRGQFAAVHTRRHDLRSVLGRINSQLRDDVRLNRDAGDRELARTVRDVFEEYADPPMIVLDAVDEAADPAQLVSELILPLSERRADGRPIAYWLVGVRKNESPYELLAAATGLGEILDLDKIDPAILQNELRNFIGAVMMRNPAYDSARLRPGRDLFAERVAAKLAHRPADKRGGEFLISGLFAHFVVSSEGPPFLGEDPGVCGDGVPVDLHKVLEMDLGTGAGSRPLRRPVLAALAHTEGAGMPVAIVRTVATLWNGGTGVPTAEEVEAALDAEALYVQSCLDAQGAMLYRLNELVVEEHLRAHPCDEHETAQNSAALLDVVLESMGEHHSGVRPWHRADLYVTQHAGVHAARENRLTELLDEPGYVIHADADLLRPLLIGACTDRGSARLLRGTTPTVLRSLDYGERRNLLALEALRWGRRELALDFMATPARDADESRVTPLWATASDLDPRQLMVFRGHADEVNAVLVVHCGGRPVAVSASSDLTIRFSDPDSGLEAAAPLTGHTGDITALAVSRRTGSASLYSASVDQTIRHWRLKPGGEAHAHTVIATAVAGPEGVLRGHTDAVLAVEAFRMGNRHMIVSGSADRTIRLWDAKSGSLQATWSGHTDDVTCLAVFTYRRQTWIASGSEDGSVRVWDVRTGTPGAVLTGHRDTVTCLTVFADQGRTLIASGSADKTVRLWDLAEQKPVGEPRDGHSQLVTAIAAIPDTSPRTLVSGDRTGALYEWNAQLSPAQGRELRGHYDEITSIWADDRVLLTCGRDASVRNWTREPATGWLPAARGHRDLVVGLASLVVDGVPVCVSADERGLRFWTLDQEEPTLLTTVELPALHVITVTVVEDDTVVVGTPDGRLSAYGVNDKSVVWEAEAHLDAVIHASTIEIIGSERLVTVGSEGRVSRWQRSGNGFTPDGDPFGDGFGVVAAATGMIGEEPVAVLADHRGLAIWNLATRSFRGTLPSRPADDVVLAFAEIAGIAHLLATRADGTIELWNLHALSLAGVLSGHRGPVTSLACHTGDGTAVLASTDAENRVLIWDLATGCPEERLVLPEPALCVHWSRQGRLVVGFGRDVAVFDASDVHSALGDID